MVCTLWTRMNARTSTDEKLLNAKIAVHSLYQIPSAKRLLLRALMTLS